MPDAPVEQHNRLNSIRHETREASQRVEEREPSDEVQLCERMNGEGVSDNLPPPKGTNTDRGDPLHERLDERTETIDTESQRQSKSRRQSGSFSLRRKFSRGSFSNVLNQLSRSTRGSSADNSSREDENVPQVVILIQQMDGTY
jgi:hypothetical protein